MNRRRLLLSLSTVGLVGTAGCVEATECTETSNHLFVENHLPDPQEIDIRVLRETEGIISDDGWSVTLSETVEIPGETHEIIEEVYDQLGNYRTEVSHNSHLEQNSSEVDECSDRVVTIGIGDGVVSIINGRPERLASAADDTDS